MKWTLNWLHDYLDTNATAIEIADKLTQIGLEVEGVEAPDGPVVARIVECSDIPDTHLHLLSVDDGECLRQVVCGAPNVRVGLVSALARPGCMIEGNEIKVGKIRGHESNGMMCSERELGLGDNHDGIVELDADKYKLGRPFFENKDAVFDAGITPNRPDYLAVRGIARDLAAAGIGAYKVPPAIAEQKIIGARKAVIENSDACPAYRLCEIHGISMAPSISTIAARLSAVGINPKNAPVDATNYVCLDIGQPMHCFDADEIHGDIIIRNAKDGEKFTDLFGDEHELIADDLVIADADGILALAGVVGGARGMTKDATKNIILESAYFAPVGVRKTARRLGISTDASYRYERGIDPTITGEALEIAACCITKTCGGEIIGRFAAGENPQAAAVSYSPELFKKKTGIDLSADKQREILTGLGFGVEENGDAWTIAPTRARVDVVIPENIVSELIRIYGYANIKQENKDIKTGDLHIPQVKKILASRGLDECVSYEFGNAYKEKLLSDRPQIKVKNPIVSDFDTARNTLIQGILDVIANNDRFKRSNLALFEIGPVFDGDEPGQQHDQLIIARTGIFGNKIGIKHGRDASIYDVRADLMALFPGAVIENDDAPSGWAHPFRAGRLVLDGKIVARFAELMPSIAKKFGIKTNVAIGLVENAGLLITENIKHVSNAKRDANVSMAEFPLITRDFAFVVDNDVAPEKIVNAAIAAENRIVETNVFDVFDMPDDKKSVAFEVVIQPESNMTDSDLLDIQGKIITSVEKLGAKIRDK